MSRIAKAPIVVPSGVNVIIQGQSVTVKGTKGALEHHTHPAVQLVHEAGELKCHARDGVENSVALSGTTRAVLSSMMTGVTEGFEKKLLLVGIGYRAQMKGKVLSLTLGYSHGIDYEVPEGISIETPSQTEIRVSGVDKQKVGQVAATIRSFRPPEPYKGKGVKYSDETIVRKEAKKK